jgi:hypothetical protein
MNRSLITPATPASSNASSAAAPCGVFPLLGQPFGIIHRLVSRDVINITSNLDLPLAL